MRRTPVVLGVLSIVFGAVQLLYTLFGLVMQSYRSELTRLATAMGENAASPALVEGMARAGDKLKTWAALGGGLFLAASVALMAVGWGLLQRRPWSRPAAVGWAAGALGLLAFTVWVQVAVTLPIMEEAVAGARSALLDLVWRWERVVLPVVMVAMYAPFPLVLGILMGRPSARRDLVP